MRRAKVRTRKKTNDKEKERDTTEVSTLNSPSAKPEITRNPISKSINHEISLR